MPRYSKRRVRAIRDDIRASRAAGATFRQLAKVYRIGIATAYRAAADVPVHRPNRWHQARQPEAPAPTIQADWSRLLMPTIQN